VSVKKSRKFLPLQIRRHFRRGNLTADKSDRANPVSVTDARKCDGAKPVSVANFPKDAAQIPALALRRRRVPRKPAVGRRREFSAASGLRAVVRAT
jgi:hypothetical protein